MNKDEYGVLGQIQGGTEHPDFPKGSIEGGDSAKWQGDYCYLKREHWWYDANGFQLNYIRFFEVKPGRYVRHPEPEMTYNGFGADLRCLSRDQMCGVLAGIIVSDDVAAMRRLIRAHAKRGFLFAWNTIDNGVDPKTAKWKLPDLTGPEIWATEIRGFEPGWYDKLLPLFDLHMLVNTLWHNRTPKYKDQKSISEHNECTSYLIKLIISAEHKPTWVSRLSLSLLDFDLTMLKLDSYWSGWRRQPEMVTLYGSRLLKLRGYFGSK